MLNRLFSQLTRRHADARPLESADARFLESADALAARQAALRAWLVEDTFPAYSRADLAADPLREQVAGLIAGGADRELLEPLLDQLAARTAGSIDRMLVADAWLRLGLPARAEPLLAALAATPDRCGARAAALLAQRLFDRGEFARAGELAERAAGIAPEALACQLLLGCMRDYEGDHDQALAHFRRAKALRPDSLLALGHLATALIRSGAISEGLAAWVLADHLAGAYSQDGACAVWDGRALGSDRLLIITSYGFGDTLQFLRFVRHLHEREPAARLAILIAPQLARLARDSGLFEAVHDAPVDRTAFDWQITQTQLPLALNIGAEDLLRFEPYLRVDPGAVAAAASWLPVRQPGRKRVGLRWSGKPLDFDAKRSIPFAALRPLFAVTNIDWVALVESADALAGLGEHALHDASAHLADFHATGALMCNLDLTISVDTSVVHLGGALGLPVWLIARPDPEWRWGEGGPGNPWYGSVRVFRHGQGFDWDALVGEMAVALRAWAA